MCPDLVEIDHVLALRVHFNQNFRFAHDLDDLSDI